MCGEGWTLWIYLYSHSCWMRTLGRRGVHLYHTLKKLIHFPMVNCSPVLTFSLFNMAIIILWLLTMDFNHICISFFSSVLKVAFISLLHPHNNSAVLGRSVRTIVTGPKSSSDIHGWVAYIRNHCIRVTSFLSSLSFRNHSKDVPEAVSESQHVTYSHCKISCYFGITLSWCSKSYLGRSITTCSSIQDLSVVITRSFRVGIIPKLMALCLSENFLFWSQVY